MVFKDINYILDNLMKNFKTNVSAILTGLGFGELADEMFGTEEQRATEDALKKGFSQESFSKFVDDDAREKLAAERAANTKRIAQKMRFQDALDDHEKVLNNRLNKRRRNMELKVPGFEAVDSFGGIVNAPEINLSSTSTNQSFTNTNMTNGNPVVNMLSRSLQE
jgi:hypothetical protein